MGTYMGCSAEFHREWYHDKYRLSTTNYLVIRMEYDIRDTVGHKLADRKGLREGWDSNELWKIVEKSKAYRH